MCGDSHTATHGAFGALAFGIGTSEVEHVLATQTLVQSKGKNMRVTVTGKLQPGVTSKVGLGSVGGLRQAGGRGPRQAGRADGHCCCLGDTQLGIIAFVHLAGGRRCGEARCGQCERQDHSYACKDRMQLCLVQCGSCHCCPPARSVCIAAAASLFAQDVILAIIGAIGTAGGNGHVIEFAGDAIASLSMEARMSICNMAIEGGARAGMIAPDQITFDYLRSRPMAPKGDKWEAAVKYWKSLPSDPDAKYDKEVTLKGEDIAPTVTWGTSPQDVAPITGAVPDPAKAADPARGASMQRSLDYMGLQPGTSLEGLKIDKVFIGSCTNARIEDIRAAAAVAKGRKVAPHVYAMVVPGSGLVKAQAEAEGLDKILTDAGFDWREPGCSMCLAMNPDKLEPGERCASTSNRNFEGRQGAGGRTHLVSPAMAAAAAVAGCLTDVRKMQVSEIPAPRDDVFGQLVAAMEAARPAPKVTPVAPGTTGSSSGSTGGAGSACDPSKQFTRLKGTAAKLAIQNIDTDMIIPKQFLKTIKRSGLGVAAFHGLRYADDGSERPDFVLNQGPYRQASIIVAGDNFGCGSSREHAPWALHDFGIRSIISTSFADIFYNNCFKNGMLPIVLPRAQVDALMEDCDAGKQLDIDLASQTITREDGTKYTFNIDSFRKNCLLNGLDDIGLTLQKADKIAAFEAKRAKEAPWFDNAAQMVVTV